MITLTKEWLLKTIAELEEERDAVPGVVNVDAANALAAMKLALASLEAEPVAWLYSASFERGHVEGELTDAPGCDMPIYTAPPAPVAVPDALADDIDSDDYPLLWGYKNGWNACRTAMLQGADGKPELTVWYGAMPETNGKTNWTAMLHREGQHPWEGITIDRSEYPGRVRYEADRMRHLIGELADEPDILAYDAEAHSGYVYPGNSPVIPDGWVMVPAEPTAEMLQSGISAHYERSQIQIHDRPAPGPMEFAYVAMLAAAPQQEAE